MLVDELVRKSFLATKWSPKGIFDNPEAQGVFLITPGAPGVFLTTLRAQDFFTADTPALGGFKVKLRPWW